MDDWHFHSLPEQGEDLGEERQNTPSRGSLGWRTREPSWTDTREGVKGRKKNWKHMCIYIQTRWGTCGKYKLWFRHAAVKLQCVSRDTCMRRTARTLQTVETFLPQMWQMVWQHKLTWEHPLPWLWPCVPWLWTFSAERMGMGIDNADNTSLLLFASSL